MNQFILIVSFYLCDIRPTMSLYVNNFDSDSFFVMMSLKLLVGCVIEYNGLYDRDRFLPTIVYEIGTCNGGVLLFLIFLV